MKLWMSGLALLVLMAVLAGPAAAQATGGAACLQITPGARADGMGRAFVALPTDATAIWWNPAALALQQGKVISLTHVQLVPGLASDVYYENMSYAMHLPGWGGVGASFIYLTYGKSQNIDLNGDYKGDFSSYEISPQLSFASEVVDGLSLGTTLKYVRVSLAPDWAIPDSPSGSGAGDSYGADIGLLFRSRPVMPNLPFSFNVGVNVQNLGPKIVFISDSNADPLPRLLKAGIGLQAQNGGFRGILSYDYNKSLVYSDEKPIHNVGAEVSFKDFVSLRAGYIYDVAGDIRDPTFGVGFVISLASLGTGGSLVIDYANVPQARELPDKVSKFSLSFRF
jgi:hypothetical protein